ncbi:BQ2448_5600 [Microbotryum intermedium]|uniref:Eukaryotic translation initiation factor 3 30 kDa subunit n=1 Tax=Microbotryum intermedium TaxID=269621 RepID=A0A238F599_9BASI|nr:BQ2448_5600 [Microbotryum intermedium]
MQWFLVMLRHFAGDLRRERRRDDQECRRAHCSPKAPIKSKFADEDASDDDVKDDWDASDDEDEDKAKKPAGPAPPVRAKGITKQKIAEKEAAEQAKKAALAAKAREEGDPAARRARERAAMLKADMENATALFGASSVNDNDPFSQSLVTKNDAETVATSLTQQIVNAYSDSPVYTAFLESFVRSICGPLNDLDVKAVGSKLTTLANEKQKAQKEAQGGGKKKKGAAKPMLGASKTLGMGRADTGAYDEVLDDTGDYDDFVT